MKWIIIFYLLLGIYAVYDFNRATGPMPEQRWQVAVVYIITYFLGPVMLILSWFLNARDKFKSRWE